MLWDPIRYAETCPSSDGACAMVLASEDVADAAAGPVAWVKGTAMRSEPTMSASRDTVLPRRRRVRRRRLRAGRDHRPPQRGRLRGDVRALLVVRADVAGEPPLRAEGEGWKYVEDGVTQLDGDLPVNMSGGVLSSNPIGASGMLRFAEAAMQVRGMAGEHQVDGARTAVGHAYGGGSQFFAMWVVGSEKP